YEVAARWRGAKERVVQGEGDRVLRVRRRREAAATDVANAEEVAVGLLVAVFEPARQPAPDLVLERRRHFPQVDVRTRRARLAAAYALGVGEILEAQRGAERFRPVVGGVACDAAPARVGLPPRAHQQ